MFLGVFYVCTGDVLLGLKFSDYIFFVPEWFDAGFVIMSVVEFGGHTWLKGLFNEL